MGENPINQFPKKPESWQSTVKNNRKTGSHWWRWLSDRMAACSAKEPLKTATPYILM
jgi:hypothetical protein